MISSTPTVSPLRQRMLDDMRMRKLAGKTQAAYVRAIRHLALFLGRSPDAASAEDLRRFQLALVDRGTSPITINATITGLKFFFETTLDQPALMAKMQPVHVPHTFRWKDYRDKGNFRPKTMTLDAKEFMRRFLLHVLPGGFHRIRHYGLLSNGSRKSSLAKARRLLAAPVVATVPESRAAEPVEAKPVFVCRHCGAAMIVIDALVRGPAIRAPPRWVTAV